MTEFDEMLAKYRKLAGEVHDQRGYLEYLEGELAELEKRMKGYVLGLQEQRSFFGPSSLSALATAPMHDQAAPKVVELLARVGRGSKALQQTADAIAAIGDGVDAVRLAAYLGISREAARLRLQRAARAGLIARMASGRYRAVKKKLPESKVSGTSDDDATQTASDRE